MGLAGGGWAVKAKYTTKISDKHLCLDTSLRPNYYDVGPLPVTIRDGNRTLL